MRDSSAKRIRGKRDNRGTGKGPSLAGFLLVVIAAPSMAQTPALPAAPNQYLKPHAVPAILRGPLAALGDRLQNPGKERFTLAGTYTDGKGSQGLQLTWELPAKMRIDFIGGSPRSVVFDGTTTKANGAAPSSSDDDLIESLADDRTEALLYNLRQRGFSMRFLGNRFRTDKGANKNYTGPFYDIFQTFWTVAARSDKAPRQKLFLFDSNTGLLVQTTYKVVRAGATVTVETVYSGSSMVAGQAVPGQIVRLENSVNVFTIRITSAQMAATAADGLFTSP